MNHSYIFFTREQGHRLKALKKSSLIYHLGAIIGKMTSGTVLIAFIVEVIGTYRTVPMALKVSIIGKSVIFLSVSVLTELGWHHDHTRPYCWEECGLFYKQI
jgi:hypothetical protein